MAFSLNAAFLIPFSLEDLERGAAEAFSLFARMDLVDARLLRNILGVGSKDRFSRANYDCGQMTNDGLSNRTFGTALF